MPPLVSVIIATYNMGRYVREAIDSVLGQDYPSVELIVVDDGSTDDTTRVLSLYSNDPRVVVIRQPNQGQTIAKNRGFNEAKGEYIAFCDADDTWIEHKLTRQIPLFDNESKIGVVYADILMISSNGCPLQTPKMRRYSGNITRHLLVDNFIPFVTAVVRRQVMEEFGGFDENLPMGIDYDLWLRISVKYEFRYIDEPLAHYRVWDGQMSRRVEERFENYFRFAERFLATFPESVSTSDVRRAWAHTYVSRGIWRLSLHEKKLAFQDFILAFRYRPYDVRLLKTVVKFIIGWKR